MDNKYFLHQIKHTNNAFEKGIVVKDTIEDAQQSYHAYLGAYAYGHDKNTDYVQCMITGMNGIPIDGLYETWGRKGAAPLEINID